MKKKYKRHDLIERVEDSNVIPPGNTIKQLCEDRKWTQEQLADKLRVTKSDLENIVNGILPISEGLATDLEKIGFASKEFWMQQEQDYEEKISKEKIERIVNKLFCKNKKED